MSEASWLLARAEPPPLYRDVVLRELRAILRPRLSVWLPTLLAGTAAYALYGLWNWSGWVDAIAVGVWIGRTADLRRRDKTATPADRWLRDDLGTGWLVDLRVLRGAAPTGQDRGVLWVEDGRLLFSGHRTSFALVPAQARRCRWTQSIPGLRGSLVLPLEGDFALSLDPLENPEDRKEIAAAIDDWTSLPSPSEGQAPPKTAGPGTLPATGLFACAFATTLAWGGLAYLLARSFEDANVLFGFVAALYAAWRLGLHRPGKRWRAWWDRLRLERER